MVLAEYVLKKRLGWLKRTIRRDIQRNEAKARQKLTRTITPLLEILDIEEDVTTTNEKGETTTIHKDLEPSDIQLLPTEKLVSILEDLITEMERVYENSTKN
jgi:hypothetical protein